MAESSRAKNHAFSLYLLGSEGTVEGDLAKMLSGNRRRQSIMRELIIMGYICQQNGARLDAAGQSIIGLADSLPGGLTASVDVSASSQVESASENSSKPLDPPAETGSTAIKQKYSGLA